jgi:hypothetical protein
MNALSAVRRLLANSDRLNDIATGSDRLYQGLDHLARDTNERLKALEGAISSVNERLERLYEATDNQSRDLNTRLDEGIKIAGDQAHSARQLIEAMANQSAAINLRLDRLVANQPPSSSARSPTLSHQFAVETERSKSSAIMSWLGDPSPNPMPLPTWSGKTSASGTAIVAHRRSASPNSLQDYQPLLDALQPWQGVVPKGYLSDFLGILTDAHFRAMFGIDPAKSGGEHLRTSIPRLMGGNGEWWFEVVNWFEAARAARGHFVMVTLGACYGAQAVGAHRVLQIVSPMPCKLVAVEPVPENYLWMRKHFRDNGINPDDHWLVAAGISDVNTPIFFPIGGAGFGANNCMSTDQPEERKIFVEELIAQGKASDALRNLMLRNTTGILTEMLPGHELRGEIELVSAVTLRDLLAPFDVVDYVEADIQQSEVRVFPPFLDLLRQKVRRIHIGTHGAENHDMLHDMFVKSGWEIIFSYGPNGSYESEIGKFELNDGVLTVRNPNL